MSARFTPGPWYADGLPDNGAIVLYHPTEGELGYVLYGTEFDRECRANARLIAAAPDMFEALQEAEKHFGPFSEITINGQHDPDDVRVVAMIRDALAKALGQPETPSSSSLHTPVEDRAATDASPASSSSPAGAVRGAASANQDDVA